MLKMTRLAALAAVLLVALSAATVPQVGQAQPAPGPAAAAPAEPAAAPAAPAAPAPKASASGRATEVVDNPYGLEALWKGGDAVARITLAILAIMSAGSWYIIFIKVYEQFKMGKAGTGRRRSRSGRRRPSRKARRDWRRPARSGSSPKPGSRRRTSIRACCSRST